MNQPSPHGAGARAEPAPSGAGYPGDTRPPVATTPADTPPGSTPDFTSERAGHDGAVPVRDGSIRPGARLRAWLMPWRGRVSMPFVLTHRRIYLLPTRHGMLFAGVLLVMLVGSVNYALNLGYALTFLLGAMAATSVLHAFRTLAGLSVDVRAPQAVFAGEPATFEIRIAAPAGADRHSIGVVFAEGSAALLDCPAAGEALTHLQVEAPRRGRHWPGRMTVFTRYPLGLVYAWSYVEPDRSVVVYPRPEFPAAPFPAADEGAGARERRAGGDDDFSGLRPWRTGESTHRIAWKAVARGSGLLAKQFEGESGHDLWLDWYRLPANLPLEAKLSRLARWAVDAEAGGLAFGLRLPGIAIEPADGRAHRDRVLCALALFDAGAFA